MKRIVTAGLLLLGSLSGQSQLFVKPEAGMAASTSNYEDNWSAGWKAGLGVEYRFKRDGKFSLQSGAYFHLQTSQIGQYVTLSLPDNYLFIADGTIKNQLLSIPLLVKWGWNLSEQVRLHVAFGPKISIGLAAGGHIDQHLIDYTFAEGSIINYSGYNNWLHAYLPSGYWVNENEYVYYDRNPYDNPMLGHTNTRTTPSKPHTEWGATATVGMDINRLSINLSYDQQPNVLYSTGSTCHQLSLTVGYVFRLTK